MTATLGELARQTRVVDGRVLEDLLRLQRQAYLEGDFRRLGEIVVDHGHGQRPNIRGLLARQGVQIVECELCQTRYNALLFRGPGTALCMRCGRRLVASDERAPLTVEDAISGGGPQADKLLAEHRQRNPRLGRYEILGEVGRGSMGVIYKAWDADLHRHVALKFLRQSPSGTTTEDRERFRREARSVAKLRHEHIVHAHAIEEQSGLVYMAMDFVPGVALEILARRGALNLEQIVGVGAKVARALHYAHEQGIVHRDVKPGNIVIDRQGKPFLVDFGIAKNRSESVSLTTEGEILGSLAYMAPEYITKGSPALDRRCDVYGLGVAVYEAITGKLPFGEDEDERLVMRILKEQPMSISAANAGKPPLPPGLEEVIMRAIARDREQRYATASALADDLEAVLQGPAALEESQRKRGEAPPAAALGNSGRTKRADKVSQRALPPGSARLDSLAVAQADEGSDDAGEPLAPAEAPPRLARGLLVGLAVAAALGLCAAAGGIGLWLRTQSRLDDLGGRFDELTRLAGQSALDAGKALEKAGDLPGAEARYGEAARYLARDPEPLEARARVREALGNRTGALDDKVEAQNRSKAAEAR